MPTGLICLDNYLICLDISKLELIGDNKGLLLNLDQELAARVFNNPFPTDSKLIG